MARAGRGVAAVVGGGPLRQGSQFLEIPISDVEPNRKQPRTNFKEEALQDLSESIKMVGILQPILVRPADQGGKYQIVAGERRFRAAKSAGLNVIPAVIRSSDEEESLSSALIENLHRQELNPLEEGAAYKALIDDFGLSHEEVANRVQKSRPAITNTIRLTELPPIVQKMLIEGKLSAGHGRALLGLKSVPKQEAIAKRAAAESWTVRQTEKEIAGKKKTGASRTSSPGAKPAALLELEKLLGEHLDTRVSVSMGRKRGKLSVEFADVEDLERIYGKMID